MATPGGGSPVGLMSVMVYAESGSVKAQIMKITKALSPVGIAAFLSGPVHQNLQRKASQRFRSEGDSAVGKWAPLSSATREIRYNMGFPPAHPINRRTGALEDHITKGAPDISVGEWGGRLLFPGGRMSNEMLEKVGTAQAGKSYPSTVARPVLGMDHEDMAQTLTALGYWIHSGGVTGGRS